MDTGKHTHELYKEGNWHQRRLERIKQYIGESLSTDLRAAVVSEKFGISISTLQHSFKKYLFQCYQQYIKKARMKRAMEMTRSGKKISKVVATERTFKHAPGRLRKRHLVQKRPLFLSAFWINLFEFCTNKMIDFPNPYPPN